MPTSSPEAKLTMASIKTDLFEKIKQAIMAMPVDDPSEEDRREDPHPPLGEQEDSPVDDSGAGEQEEPEANLWESGEDLSSPNTLLSEDESGEAHVDKLFEIKPQESKGLGMVATQDIESLTIICQERPVLVCPAGASSPAEMDRHMLDAMEGLTLSDRDFILHGLVNANNDPNHLSGCYRTNALPCGRNGDRGAIFKNLAMVNHSCAPNAEYSWEPASTSGNNGSDGKDGTGALYSLTDIRAGEEITISYVDLQPHAARRERLRAAFGFSCACALCGLSKKRRRAEDRRIREIEGLELTLLSDPRRLRPADADENLARFQDLATLYRDSEVNHHRDLLRLYDAVVRLCIDAFDMHVAVAHIVRVCGMTEEAALEACREWYD